MEKFFALYDSDVFYATRFMEYFRKKIDFRFELSVFTQKESLEEFLSHHKIEILLVDDTIELMDISTENVKYIYQLLDYSQKERPLEPPGIFKYQSVKAVMSELLSDYNKKVNNTWINYNPHQTEFISIFSLIHNSETLSFTWAVSSLMSEQNKVLLVMLDLLQVPFISPINSSNYSLSEFIYYLKENNDIIAKMKLLLDYQDNLSYLKGNLHGEDILSLRKEDVRKWVEELRLHTDYRTVIFFIDCPSEAMIELINLSSLVLVTNTGTVYEASVRQVWMQQLERSGVNMNSDKLINIALQSEEIGQFPIQRSELMNSLAWSSAEQWIMRRKDEVAYDGSTQRASEEESIGGYRS